MSEHLMHYGMNFCVYIFSCNYDAQSNESWQLCMLLVSHVMILYFLEKTLRLMMDLMGEGPIHYFSSKI